MAVEIRFGDRILLVNDYAGPTSVATGDLDGDGFESGDTTAWTDESP